MKKAISGIIASAALAASFNAAAITTVPQQQQTTFNREVTTMTEVMNLIQVQSDAILQLKADLYKNNQKANNAHGFQSEEAKKLRQQNMRAYTRSLSGIITDEQQKTWNDYRRNL